MQESEGNKFDIDRMNELLEEYNKGRDYEDQVKFSTMYIKEFPKNQYIHIVNFTLKSMLDLAKTDKLYHFQSDLLYYYNKKIKPDNVITKTEFLDICNELGISTKILEEQKDIS